MVSPGSATFAKPVDTYHQYHISPKGKVPNNIFGIEGTFGRTCDNLRNGGCVGLYGIGGIGKTTLARLVYDHYLEDYTEAAYVELGQNANLLECINVLLKKLGVTSEADDATKTECWKACLRRKKVMYKPVLLLLDNVWDQGDLETLLQMDLLARGSRVIITTRLEGILDKFADSVQKIEVPGLNDEEAKKLLRSSARIKDTMMNENLLVCEEKIIKGCFGVPLLLKVVGGVLLPNRTDKDSWEHVCARLSDFDSGSKALDEKIQKILSLQLELVDGLCRDMFYDVATALHGWPIDQCLRAWALMYNDELGNDAKMKVITRCTDLLDTSLVKFDDENGVVQIHDILRHLGRVQCRSEGKRVWVEDGKLQGLKIFKGEPLYENVVMASLDRCSEDFLNEHVTFMKNLVALSAGSLSSLSASFGQGWTSLKRFDLRECIDLQSLPESFGRQWTALKQLNLSWCYSLQSLPESFGWQWTALQELDLSCCYSLQSLPESFGQQWTALQVLNLSECCSLQSLPESFGQGWRALQELDLYYCRSLKSLPKSFGQGWMALKQLNLSDCRSLQSLPESFGQQWTALQELDLSECSALQSLPESFGQGWMALQELDLSKCSALKSLPESFGQQWAALQFLNLSGCRSIESLPESFGQGWTALDRLDLSQCTSLQSLPESFGQGWMALQELDLYYCHSLKSLPKSFGQGWMALQDLDLSSCLSLQSLPESFGQQWTALQLLKLIQCSSLQSLPESFGQGWTALKQLNLSECSSLQSLPESFGQGWTGLQVLNLSVCRSLQSLPESFGQEWTALQVLDLSKCRALKSLPESFGQQWAALQFLNLSGCRSIESLPESFGQQWTALQVLNLSGCRSLQSLPESFGQGWTALKEWNLSECSSLQSLPESFGQEWTALQVLNLSGCSALQSLPESFGQQWTALHELSLDEYDDLEGTDIILNALGYRAIDDDDVSLGDKTRLHGGLVKASENNKAAVCAFDNKGKATTWLALHIFQHNDDSSRSPWLEYRLRADCPPVMLKKYTLTSASDFPEWDPSCIEVKCWDDKNREWTVLDEQDDIEFPERGHQLEFEVAPSTFNPFSRRFRLYILNVAGTLTSRMKLFVQLSGWHLYCADDEMRVPKRVGNEDKDEGDENSRKRQAQ